MTAAPWSDVRAVTFVHQITWPPHVCHGQSAGPHAAGCYSATLFVEHTCLLDGARGIVAMRADQENAVWTRGHLAHDSPEALALLTAFALGE